MADPTKKISFGFSKLSKQALVPKPKKSDHEKGIQYIDCLESKSIKVRDANIKEEIRELVIPARNKQSSNDLVDKIKLAREGVSVGKSAPVADNINPGAPESLEAIAAREIIEDLEKKRNSDNNGVLTLPVTEVNGVSSRAPTLDDYESVPVSEFGLAMLRGMGWCPGKGIGKSDKIAPASATPVLRPKGMGLGAGPIASTSIVHSNGVDEEEGKIFKGAFVKVTAGIHKDTYGKVEGFDEDGRVIIKSALGKSSVSVLECILKLVSESDYKRHSRVLNLSQYEEQKKNEGNDSEIKYQTDFSEHKRRRTENDR